MTLEGLIVTDDDDLVFAEDHNTLLNAHKSNYVLNISGAYTDCKVSANPSSDLTNASQPDVDISSGYVHVNSVRSNQILGSLDLSTEYALLSSGQSLFVYIYVDSSSNLQKIAGTPATTGQQLPPDMASITGEFVVLARILLTYGDTQVNDVDIKDMRVFGPTGMFVLDNDYIRVGNSSDLLIFHNGSHSYIKHIGTGSLIIWNDTAGNDVLVYTRERFGIRDRDDSDVYLFSLDTTGRTLTLGNVNDPLPTSLYGELRLQWMSGAEGGQLNFKGDGSTYLNDFYIDRYANRIRFVYGNNTRLDIDPDNTQIVSDLHVIPELNNTYDLGSATNKWRSLYVSSDAYFYGPIRLAADGFAIALGASADFYVYHDGVDNILKLNNGDLQIRNTTSELLRVDQTTGNLSVVKQVYAYNFYDGPSSSVSVTASAANSTVENSLSVKTIMKPLANALPRNDYTVEAAVNITALDEYLGWCKVRVEIKKDGATWLDSGFQDVSSTGLKKITVGTNVAFDDAEYEVILYVQAYKQGTTSDTSVTAKLESVIVYI